MIIQGTYNKGFLPRGIQFFNFLWAALRFKRVKKIHNHFSGSLDSGVEYEAVWPYVERHSHYPVTHDNYREWYVPGNPKAVLEAMVGKHYQWNNFIFHIIKTFTGLWLGPVNAHELYCVEVVCRALIALGYKDVKPDWINYQLQTWLEQKSNDLNSGITEICNVSEKPGKLLTWLYDHFNSVRVLKIGKKFVSFLSAGPIIYLWVVLWGVFKAYQLHLHEAIFWQPWPDCMFASVLTLFWLMSFTPWIKTYYEEHFPKTNKK